MEHSGITYTGLTQYTSPEAATWCNIPVQQPFIGASYIFDLTTISAGWELCNQSGAPFNVYWDSFEVILTSYIGRFCVTFNECTQSYNATINYYLSGVLQVSNSEIVQFTEFLVSQNPNCPPAYTMENQVMMFIVDVIRPTPTPTNTSTPTNTPTQTKTPTPTPTLTSNFICPTQFSITNSTNPDIINGTYTRSSIYSGGSFNYGYNQESGATDSLIFTTATDGNNYPIFQYYDGVEYHTIFRRFLEAGTNIGFFSQTQSTNPLIYGFDFPLSANGFGTGFTTFNSIRFPKAGLMEFGLDGVITYPVICPTPTPTSGGTTPTPTPTQTNTGTPSPTNTTTPTPTTTRTPTPTPNPYCYTLETVQSAPGECFLCPGYFASTTDTIIEFFSGCSGTTIPAPFNMNVIAHYSDSSTGNTYISGGTVGSVVIATSDIQCVAPPTCGEVASPTFDFLTISGGTITECCV